MAEHEDVADFSYDIAGASSWNPAFRPDHHSPLKEIFSQSEVEVPPAIDPEPVLKNGDTDKNDDPPTQSLSHSFPRRSTHSRPSTAEPYVFDTEPTSDEGYFGRDGTPQTDPPPQDRPRAQFQEVSKAWEAIQQEPHAQLPEEKDVGLQMEEGGQNMEMRQEQEHPPADIPTVEASVEGSLADELHATIASKSEGEAYDHVETTYEHQGENTALEEAFQEDPKAPLFNGIPTPVVEWGDSDDWDIGASEQQEAKPGVNSLREDNSATPIPAELMEEQQHLEATAFLESTTKKDILPEESQEQELDWGTSEDVDFGFGAGLDGNEPSRKAVSQETEVPDSSLGATTDDLANLWAAELGDDELLVDEVDSAAFGFEDDGEGFLEDLPVQQNTGSDTMAAEQSQARLTHEKYAPEGFAPAQQTKLVTPSNPYFPQNTPFTDLVMHNQQSTLNKSTPASPYQAAYNPTQSVRPQLITGESFADKAKGGYASPYDLPEDLNVSRRRATHHHKLASPDIPPSQAPPRLSNMRSMSALNPSRPQPPASSFSVRNFTPLTPSYSVPPPNGPSSATNHVETKLQKPPSSDFFADLPIVQRPVRHATPSGRYASQTVIPTPPPPSSGMPPPMLRPSSYSTLTPSQTHPPMIEKSVQSSVAQLQAPPRLPPYAEDSNPLNRPTNVTAIPPPASTRYSPAVQGTPPVPRGVAYPPPAPATASVSGLPSGLSRYSPAPAAQPSRIAAHNTFTSPPAPPLRTQSQQYAPRTSSPLAYRPMQDEQQETPAPMASMETEVPNHLSESFQYGRPSYERIMSVASQQSLLETVSEHEPPEPVKTTNPQSPQYAPDHVSTSPPPPSRSGMSSSISSPRRKANYAPSFQPATSSADPSFAPPQRAQTSSPSAAIKHPRLALTARDRPASAHGPISPKMASAVPATAQTMHQQPAYDESKLLTPRNQTAEDSLQRWRGAPIFNWGIGNRAVTAFPSYIPRYGSGHVGAMIQPTMVTYATRNTNDIIPPSESFIRFPGPLKKGKKKEVLTWLKSSIEQMEFTSQQMILNGKIPPTLHQQREEKLLLWKVMALMIEHDGVLEGSVAIDEAVRKLVSPSVSGQTTIANAFGETQPPITALPEAFDPTALNVLRNHLYQGKREEAVWHAADQRLWAHALLIASTLNNKDLWKQVVQEFVRKEIRKIGDNTEALGALYQVFAGNWEESIDELVSVSARHGFQMISTANQASAQKDALAGLDRWRETLLLILNNRSAGDAQALVALGKLLSGYGRLEAAHVCFLFSRSAAIFAGADDSQAHFSLIGGAPAAQGLDFGGDLDTILLSEVFEFSFTLGSLPVPPIPHLQAYKMYHAEILADQGKGTEAQQYCDMIASIMQTKSNRSAYYNKQLMDWVNDLNQRLAQAPPDNSSSWKPSMDKVSTSFWGKFNTFIAGEDNSTVPNGFSNTSSIEHGQFARLTGETPPMTRAASSADMYGAYQRNGHALPSAPSNSRYAPSIHADLPRSASSMEYQRSRYEPQSQSAYQPRISGESSRSAHEARTSLDAGILSSSQQDPRVSNTHPTVMPYAPTSETHPSPAVFSPQGTDYNHAPSSHSSNPYQSPQSDEYSSSNPPYQPLQVEHHQMSANEYRPVSSQVDVRAETLDRTQSYGYEPAVAAYESSSYQPYQPEDKPWDVDEPDPPTEERKSKKKSFLDDDDDDDEIFRKAAELKAQSKGKSKADVEAEEAFRRAAEADAHKAPELNKKASWFGVPSFGWGKKNSDAAAPGKVYKANLGDSKNSFVYDSTLGRWVNTDPNAPKAEGAASAAPPPPKASGPPSRPPSSAMAPPSSRTSSPSTGFEANTPIGRVGGPPSLARSVSSPMPPPGGTMSAPPSRPTTGMSNVSDIDDLLGPAAPRRAGGKKVARKGRYVDVMANQK